MGMSIDEAVNVIHKMLAYTDLSVRANLKADMIDACHMAIDTMRKYQKIEELYDFWRSGKCEYTISCMENIGKVLRDGKID